MRVFLITVAAVLVVLTGAFFYLSDPDIPRARLEAKYAAPPSQFVQLPDGSRAHVRDRGPRNAPVLVLIHGNMVSLFTWEPWASRLDDTFRVVTMDLPGHGLTGAVPSGDYTQKGMVEFVEAVADQLGLGRFAIGGHSMGGGVAARFAETYPERVTQLNLIDAVGMASKPPDKPSVVSRALRAPVLNQVMLHITPRPLVAQTLKGVVVRKSIVTDAIIDQFWEFLRMTGTRQATFTRNGLPRNTYVRDHIGDIKAPTLILWGDKDPDIPVTDGQLYLEIKLRQRPYCFGLSRSVVCHKSAPHTQCIGGEILGGPLAGCREPGLERRPDCFRNAGRSGPMPNRFVRRRVFLSRCAPGFGERMRTLSEIFRPL